MIAPYSQHYRSSGYEHAQLRYPLAITGTIADTDEEPVDPFEENSPLHVFIDDLELSSTTRSTSGMGLSELIWPSGFLRIGPCQA
jgi:hypothetical protein